jgi:hypothetical protein
VVILSSPESTLNKMRIASFFIFALTSLSAASPIVDRDGDTGTGGNTNYNVQVSSLNNVLGTLQTSVQSLGRYLPSHDLAFED